MPAADFAAAQERIAARRAQRAAHARAQHASPPPLRALARLPFPLNRLSAAGLGAWDAVKGREGTRPEFRVGQVDAELLDDELLELLKAQVGDGLKFYGFHITDTYAAEILLALRVVLFKLSIWNNNASYGAHLQGLRYTDARSNAPNRPPPKPWQKAAYGLITIGGRYAWSKWEDHLLSASEDYTHPASAHHSLLTRITESLSNAHSLASLASFLVFLANGRYRTLTDRLLRLRLTPTTHSTSREVSFEYLNRQLVWHAFTEFLLFLLPLVGITRWRRILSRSLRRLRTAFLSLLGRSSPSTNEPPNEDDEQTAGPLAALPERTCAICFSDQNPPSTSESDLLVQSSASGGVIGSASTDITNPYVADCGCVYCFACVAQRIASEEGEGWLCLRCGGEVKTCAAWEGDVLPSASASRKTAGVRRSDGSGVADEEYSQHRETGGNGKSVLFARSEVEDEEEDASLQHVDPSPEVDVDTDASTLLEKTRGLDLGDSLAFSESSAWGARDSSDEDEQSEEYDKDKKAESEELEKGM
ncbi:peroxisome assembly protein (Peroxin-2) [Ascochyta lentis]